MPDQTFVVGTLPKGTDQIQVAISDYKGVRYCDIRRWYLDKKSGEFRPTKEGVTFGLKQIKEMRAFLEEAEQLAKEKGWLGND